MVNAKNLQSADHIRSLLLVFVIPMFTLVHTFKSREIKPCFFFLHINPETLTSADFHPHAE